MNPYKYTDTIKEKHYKNMNKGLVSRESWKMILGKNCLILLSFPLLYLTKKKKEREATIQVR